MAVKDVVEYYNQVCEQYEQMNSELLDFQKEVENGLVEPERLDTIKQVIEPLKNNYMTLSWIMYLLNKPQRGSKKKSYERRSKSFTSKLDSSRNKSAVLQENMDVIAKMKDI